MRFSTTACAALMFGLAPAVPAQQAPLLQIQGKPYFGGSVTLHVQAPADVGELVWLCMGLDPLPLDAPVWLSKGPWYIGNLLHSLALGTIPSNGRLDLAFTMPASLPSAEGLTIALQAYVAPSLSNPATLRLDHPYLLAANASYINHPMPVAGAVFGDKVAAGDFNADGSMDLAVGAWFENVAGAFQAGRVYVMWGPDFTLFTQLSPAAPFLRRHFGQGLAVADFDSDGIDDLAVGEGTGGDPPIPDAHGSIHLFRGGPAFSINPWHTVTSAGTGQEAYVFGRMMRVADINGDQVPDLVVGAPDATVQGKTRAGRVEVFLGPAYANPLLIENPEPKQNDFFGSRVGLGDVTGDGIADIVEGSGRAKVGSITQAGRLHVYDGPTLGLLATIDNPSPATNDRFGEGLFVSDLDGDGTAEVIAADVKNNFYVAWEPLETGPISSWPKPPSPNPTGSANLFGLFVAAGDANKDLHRDLVIADPAEGDAPGCGILASGGTFYVFLAPYFVTSLRYPVPNAGCNDVFSWDLAVFDLNGDEIADIVSGNPGADIGMLQNVGQVVIVEL